MVTRSKTTLCHFSPFRSAAFLPGNGTGITIKGVASVYTIANSIGVVYIRAILSRDGADPIH